MSDITDIIARLFRPDAAGNRDENWRARYEGDQEILHKGKDEISVLYFGGASFFPAYAV